MFYQVTLSYAVFNILVKGSKIVYAPPIGDWMIGKSFMYVCEWIAKKHGTLKRMGEENADLFGA